VLRDRQWRAESQFTTDSGRTLEHNPVTAGPIAVEPVLLETLIEQ
jgi:hypothetical protein